VKAITILFAESINARLCDKPRPADPIFAASETHLPRHGRFISNPAYFGLRQAGREASEISHAHSRKQGFIREFTLVVRGERIVRLSFLEVAMVKWQNRSTQ
jgi:hypothetical protein